MFSSVGMVVSTAGILSDNQQLFQAGVSSVFIGSLFVFAIVVYILRIK
jgi:hypothetical protein